MIRVLLITAFTFLSINVAFSQLLEKGEGWVRVSQQFISSNSYFDPDEQAMPIRTNSLYITNVQGNYGLSDRLTASLLLPVFVRTTINEVQFNQTGNTIPGASLNSIGDAEIGARFTFRKKLPVQIIGFVALGLPFGKKGGVGLDTDLQTGDGEFNQLIGIQLRHTFSSFHVEGYTAFNNRSEDFSSEIRYGFEAGYTANKIMITARLNSIESLFNDTAPVSQNGIFSNHRELISPGVEVLYNFSKRFGVFASVDFIVAGRNTLNAPLFGVGLQLKKYK